MAEVAINPLDYATTFTFRVEGSETEEFNTSFMRRNGQWMICHVDPTKDIFDVYTLDGTWLSVLAIDRAEVGRLSFERDRAMAIAHQFATAASEGADR